MTAGNLGGRRFSQAISPRRWPVYRSAAAIRTDLAAEVDAASAGDLERWSELAESITDAERESSLDADRLVTLAMAPLEPVEDAETGEVSWTRRVALEPIVVPVELLARPALPEPVAVALTALRSALAPITWERLGARLGFSPFWVFNEPLMEACRSELVHARLARQLADGRWEALR